MPKYVIGTAGHIDHGKTTLIKELSGVDTDTHKEEKRRGITINLGFTKIDINGEEIGVVDVPGHEKLIKNMLSGVFGMDLILLVVAADDSVMPQTIEHLKILSYLGKKNILPVITKCDLVTAERIEEVKFDIKKLGLINPFIYYLGKNNEELKSEIINRLKHNRYLESNIVKYPIDRVFTKEGVGAITTGTLISGSINVGDKLVSLPSEKVVEVKGIEKYGNTSKTANQGERVALNIKTKGPLTPGMTFTKGKYHLTKLIDVEITNPDKFEFISGRKYKLHVYTSNYVVQLKLIKKSTTTDTSFVGQLIFTDNVYLSPNDLGVIRNLSPVETVGGVKVLRVKDNFVKKNDENYYQDLSNYLSNDSSIRLNNLLKKNKYLKLSNIDFDLSEIINNYIVIDEYVFGDEYLTTITKELTNIINNYHKNHPELRGINFKTVHQQLFSRLPLKVTKNLIKFLGYIVDDVVSSKEFKIEVSIEERRLEEKVLKLFSSYHPPFYEDVLTEEEVIVFKKLVNQGSIQRIDSEIYISQQLINSLKKEIINHFNEKTVLTISDAREMMNTTRKYIVPILEYFDIEKFLKRTSDGRVLY